MTHSQLTIQSRLSLSTLLGITAGTTGAILLMWAVILGLGGLRGGIDWLFWMIHILLLAAMVTSVVVYGRRGCWSLFGIVALLPMPLLIVGLQHACAANQMCV